MSWMSSGPKVEDGRSPSERGSGSSRSGELSGPILTDGDFRGARMGLGGALLVILVSVVFQRSIFESRTGVLTQTISRFGSASRSAGGGELHGLQSISFILDDAQKTWERLLEKNRMYRQARVVFFQNYTTSECFAERSVTGPLYCPANGTIYLDLGYFDDMASRPGVPGEFAQAYVIAHEVGHHVQRLLGSESQLSGKRQAASTGFKQSARDLELQADCLAGIWGHSTRQREIIDEADIAAGMDAATAASSNRPEKVPGRVSPETFAYGSTADRLQWFRRGLESGSILSCNSLTTE